MHDSQIGGRKQRSIINAALLLHNFVEENKMKNRVVSTVFLHILVAFDRLQPVALIKVLHKVQLSFNLISWVESFLTGRTMQLCFNGHMSSEFQITGTPQGSPVSSLLFLLSIRYLYSQQRPPNFLPLSYIDELSISVATTSVDKNIRLLKAVTDNLIERANKLSATFEMDITELIHFPQYRKPLTSTLILQYGATLQPIETLR